MINEDQKEIENSRHFFGPFLEKLAPGLEGVYIGCYQDQEMHGFGKMILENGVYLEGEFENGQPRWSVLILNKNGTYFEGNLPGKNIQGSITRTKIQAEVLKGARTEGQGFEFRKDGSLFKGNFEIRGHVMKKKDTGSETLADGTVSRGMWYNDMKHGHFVTVKPNGECTKEYWSNGKLDKADSSSNHSKLR